MFCLQQVLPGSGPCSPTPPRPCHSARAVLNRRLPISARPCQLPLRGGAGSFGTRKGKDPIFGLWVGRPYRRKVAITMSAQSEATFGTEEKGDIEAEEQKSEIYSNNMTQAMGAVLTYRHELGMNYDFILPDLIIGSCLQTPADVDRLRQIGVKTIFCLQKDSDLEYFDVDIASIQEYARQCGDIQHCRAEIRDFDGFDLRMRLPTVVSKLHKVINHNGGITYVHCTAGLGRAPAVTLAYMFWVKGYSLNEARNLILSKRSCFLNLEAIKNASADILTGLPKKFIRLMWESDTCSLVEVSGLDVGWGQRILLEFDEQKGAWILERELPEGKYENKYIVDGEWTHNEDELMTEPNNDGYVNNFIEVQVTQSDSGVRSLRQRLMDDADADLTKGERQSIKEFLETHPNNKTAEQ